MKKFGTTLSWNDGKPERSGDYIVAIFHGDNFRIDKLPYSTKWNAWNAYDHNEMGTVESNNI